MRRTFRQTAVALLLGTAVAGCGGSPDVHDLAQNAHSWAATGELTGDRWMHGAISRRYTVVALERASTGLDEIATSAAELRDTSAATRREHRALSAQLSSARTALSTLDSAAARDDRRAAAAPTKQLARVGAQLDSVAAAAEQR